MSGMRICLVIVFFFPTTAILGQDAARYLGGAYFQGFVIVHSQDVESVKNSYPQGFQIDLGKHKMSEKVWNACLCYPRSGVSLTFWDFDNPDVLGFGATGMYHLQPVFRADRDFSFSVRGGVGLSYQSNPYDPVSNPDNQSYSTTLAFPLQLGVGLHYKLGEQWQIEARFLYDHISNASIKQPNKGINWPNAGLAISRYFRPVSFPEREKTNWRTDTVSLHRTDITSFATYQEPENGVFLLSGGLEVKHARRIARLNSLSFGAEWMYDTNQSKISEEMGRSSGHHLGAALGHEFILGKFLFSQQFGVYFLKPISRPEDVYQRYGLVYRFNQAISAGANLKVHGHVADFLDLRIGYSF